MIFCVKLFTQNRGKNPLRSFKSMLFILYQVSPLKSSRSSNKSPVDLASKKGCERRNDCALSIQVEPSALPLSGSPVTSSAPSVLFSKPTVGHGNANNGFPSLISSSEPGEESVNWSAYVSNIAQWIFPGFLFRQGIKFGKNSTVYWNKVLHVSNRCASKS